jgi:hypothetical protein
MLHGNLLGGLHRWGVRPLLFVFVLSSLLMLQQAAITGPDGHSTYEVTRALVEHGDITVPKDLNSAEGRGGEEYSRFGIGLSLVSTVPYVVAKPFAALLGREDKVEGTAVATLMPLVTALLCVVLYEIALALDARPRDAVLVALMIVFGTYLLPYSKQFYGEPVLALAIAVAVWRTLAGHHSQAAASLAFGMLVRPQAVVLGPLFWLYWARRDGVRRSLLPGALLASGAVGVLLYNWLRFGDLTETGYPPDQGFTLQVWNGAWGLFADPNKSVFIFIPLVFALPFAIRAVKHPSHARGLLTGVALIGFLTAASWTEWHGDWAWGPRLVLPALIPVLPVLAIWIRGSARKQRVVIGLAVAGLLVNVPAVIVPVHAQQLDETQRRGPSLVRQVELIGPTTSTTFRHLPSADAEPGAHRKYLYFWQANARRELGVAGLALSVLLSVGLVALALAALGGLRTRLSALAG